MRVNRKNRRFRAGNQLSLVTDGSKQLELMDGTLLYYAAEPEVLELSGAPEPLALPPAQ